MTAGEDGVWSEVIDLTGSGGSAGSGGTAGGDETRSGSVSGQLAPGAPDWIYLPVELPESVTWLAVRYRYNRPPVADGALGNAADLGVFGPSGTTAAPDADGRGFRGWSGGARTEFMITERAATPGYLPGPLTAGVWHVVLAPYTVSAAGLDFVVDVEIGFGEPPEGGAALPAGHNPAPQRIPGRGRGSYRGDSHVHTIYSDGRRTPAQAARLARERGLDFMISTEHNTPAAHPIWGDHAGDDLLIITGEEVTTRTGHLLALGIEPGSWIDWRFRASDGRLRPIIDQIHDHGGIAVAAHPYGGCLGCYWRFGFAGLDAVEVWNGPWSIGNEAAVATWDNLLVAGIGEPDAEHHWLPAMGNSDAHADPDLIGLPQTVVAADSLSSRDITAAIAAGRSWISDSADIELSITAASADRVAGIGDRLGCAPLTPITVTVEVGGVPDGSVRLITDQGPVHVAAIDRSGRATVDWQTTAAVSRYVRAEVRHPATDGNRPTDRTVPPPAMAALTNPIFLG